MADQPNPSFIVINVFDSSLKSNVVERLAELSSEEAGSPLTPLGSGRYVISRAVSRRIRARHSRPLIFLQGITGVDLARFVRADQIMALYGALDPADPERYAGTPDNVEDVEGTAAVPWHNEAIGVPSAWELLSEKGLDGHVSQRRVALIDTGYTRHKCFGSWSDDLDSCFLVDAGENYIESGPPLDPVKDQYPGHPGHGTRVASVIAATGKIGGVAKGARLVPYRVTRNVVIGSSTPLHKALDDALSEGCEIANISLGCPCDPGRENGRAVDKAYREGMIVVAAAGNVTSEVTYPGRHARTITAAGVTMRDGTWTPWSGGSRGRRVDFCAPADRITRADWIRNTDGTWSDEFEEEKGDGTSYAAALISGIACLWITRWDTELTRYTKGWQIVEAFRKVVGETCHVPPGWDHNRFGRGVVNAEAVLKADLPDPDVLEYERDRAKNDLF